MTAVCASCHAKIVVKALKGSAPCCGTWNSLSRIASTGDKEREKRTNAKREKQVEGRV
jgi:predicted ATP-dependent serine protease